MLIKSTLLNAIKISFAAAYDFNQYVPRPANFDPFPAPPRTVGKGGVPRPAPPHRFFAKPLPALPCPVKKIASPSIPDRMLPSPGLPGEEV